MEIEIQYSPPILQQSKREKKSASPYVFTNLVPFNTIQGWLQPSKGRLVAGPRCFYFAGAMNLSLLATSDRLIGLIAHKFESTELCKRHKNIEGDLYAHAELTFS